jgi:imidazole glycerol-phosphate synthase subunit HisF
MLRPRIIPCLLVKNGGLVKTVNFGNPKYVGDPINAVRIFNEKEVDEIMVIDIDATLEKRDPDYVMIERIAEECRMPLCYGGGVKTSAQIQRIIELGVEKVALSSAAIRDSRTVSDAAERVGSQSIVVVLDVNKGASGKGYEVMTHNGRQGTGENPIDIARQMTGAGAGEIVVNSIDNDGLMKGYDLVLAEEIRKAIHVPLTILGGAGSLNDIAQLIKQFGSIGAAAGSLFVFKGVYKAVLINYPTREEKDALIPRSRTLG